jgi:pyridinium-3,5-biscarboxylic acid mononucleotide sulfurtransferase
MTMVEQSKLDRLNDLLRSMRRVIVAFSAGVDSTFLLKVAIDVLGQQNVVACTAVSPSLAQTELQSVRDLAGRMGATLRLIETREMDNPRYAENSAKRCYFCKSELYEKVGQIAKELGIAFILNGANQDDTGDYRPGMQAAKEYDVRSPLLDAGMTKADIREFSRQLGLPTWDKPALACLASRVPYGIPVTIGSLSQIEQAEALLRQRGFRICRVRHHNNLARIEVPADRIAELLAEPLRGELLTQFKEIGYTYVTVDIQGFRSGSGNEVLASRYENPRKSLS